MIPERPAAENRLVEYNRDVGKTRRRIDDNGDAVVDHDGATTCSMALDEETGQNMDYLDEIDRRILASLIMTVDVTDVFSPARVNRFAAKFGDVPGASFDFTNGWGSSLAEDLNRAWKRNE